MQEGNYYESFFGADVKVPEEREHHNAYFDHYSNEWNKAVKRLKESGCDLSRIRLIPKG